MNEVTTEQEIDRIEGVPARYWQFLDDGRIQCDLCPRECRLQDAQRGLCFVRGRANDELVLTTYGRSSGFCVDPIEKKPLNHFFPGSPVLSFGTAGCNLTCRFCQNHDISKSRKMDRLMQQATPQAIAAYAQQTGSLSVAYTYNDPVIFLEYAVDVAQACRERNIFNVAVTAGYIKEQAREEFFGAMDAVNLDIKAFSEGFYHKLCSGHLDNVLETAKYIHHETRAWLEITMLLIPDENDDPAEIERFCRWVLDNLGPDVPVHFTAFHPDFRMLDKPRTPPQTLLKAWKIAKMGIHYPYTGNILHEATHTTYCPQCDARLIGRNWHKLTHWQLGQGGHCPECSHTIAGVFKERPGDWGRKRMPVAITPIADNSPKHNADAQKPENTQNTSKAITPNIKVVSCKAVAAQAVIDAPQNNIGTATNPTSSIDKQAQFEQNTTAEDQPLSTNEEKTMVKIRATSIAEKRAREEKAAQEEYDRKLAEYQAKMQEYNTPKPVSLRIKL